MSNTDIEELRKKVKSIIEAELTATEVVQYAIGNKSAITNIMIEQVMQLIQQKVIEAQERGMQIGQYQVADSLYGDITNIYLFKDGGSKQDLKLKKNADDHARDLLKDCEKYMNKNNQVYAEYISKLNHNKKGDSDDRQN